MAQTPHNLTTIGAVLDSLDRKAVSATELTRETLKRAKASQHNAYLHLCEERAMKQAAEADTLIAREGRVPRDRKPLLGIPLGVKDNLVMEGVRTTCASKILGDYRPPYTATCVERLEAAGAITIGKTNLDEFAMGGSNENSAFGSVKHPQFADRVPGGSSGGSATAVGADLCMAALGSDTGGSIRLPASYCGIVGMKPTYGRVSRYGLVAFASSLDQVGPMTRSVEDTARVLEVMGGHDPKDATTSPRAWNRISDSLGQGLSELRGLRVGVPREYFVEGLEPAVEKSVRAAIAWMEKQGAKVVPVSLPHTKYAVSVYYIVAVSEASSNLARFDGVRFGSRPPAAESARDLTEFYTSVRSQFGPEVKRRIILGTFALSSGYADAYYKRACQVRRLIAQDFVEAFKSVDLIAGPISPTTAFKLGEKAADPLKMYLNDIFTIPANLAGLPSISVPCGVDGGGLPIGIHLQAPVYSDDRLLRVAYALEKGVQA